MRLLILLAYLCAACAVAFVWSHAQSDTHALSQVIWLGQPMVGQREALQQYEAVGQITVAQYLQTFAMKTPYDIGLRADGVVVWRRIPQE